MFSLEFLHVIRRHELALVERYLPVRGRILEIGGGTGFQARLLAERGFEMVSIDVAQSNYADDRVFPVVEYDGTSIPFTDRSFDVVFSSNVLEHVKDYSSLHREICRVLKPGGFCLHAMPTGGWSFWTIVTHYLSAGQRLHANLTAGHQSSPPTVNKDSQPIADRIRNMRRTVGISVSRVRATVSSLKAARPAWRPPRHGEVGNAFTEVLTFSRFWWRHHFRVHGYHVSMVRPMGLFYTGYMLRGAKWPLCSRERSARFLGSACILYKVEPKCHRVSQLKTSDQKRLQINDEL